MDTILRRFAVAAVFACFVFTTSGEIRRGLVISQMRCENLDNPLGIDTPHPRLGWKLQSSERGQRQTAYEILAFPTRDNAYRGKGELWDSGKVISDATTEVEYSGPTLNSRQQFFWRVRAWDAHGDMYQSEPAFWEMGLLATNDWQAKWIGRTVDSNASIAPLLRNAFMVEGPVKQARAYVCGLGYFEMFLNGTKVSDHFLEPGYTRYDRRDLYVTYDITRQIMSGSNAVGVVLGNGWLNVINKTAWDFDKAAWRSAPKLLCQIEIEYRDGHRQTIGSSSEWKTSDSAITYNTIYSGHVYDGRLEQPGWDTAKFDDSSWTPALAVTSPGGILSPQMMPSIRIEKVFDVANITEPKSGVYVLDFGQSMTGFVKPNLNVNSGKPFTLIYGERLSTNGLLDQADIAQHVKRFDTNQRFQEDVYLATSRSHELADVRFSYNGFRYVQVEGVQTVPTKYDFKACFLHSDVPAAGQFECSNPLINKIAAAAGRSYLGNLQGIPTDCPHREKNGWTGDAHLAAELGIYNYFPSTVYDNWIQDICDEQHPDGKLPGIVPTGGWGYAWGNGPAWDSALLLIPYYQYLYYGETAPLKRHYESLKRYVDYLTGRAKGDIVSIGLNDWVPYKTKTDAGITDTAYYYIDSKIVALAAKLCGNTNDQERYSLLANQISAAFDKHFYHGDTASYDKGSQTALSCALYQGLVAPQNRGRVASNLVTTVHAANDHIDTGILGAKYLLNALTETGHADLAYQIVTQTTMPGWGWWMEQGATTLWEQWDGGASRYHVMFGDVDAWFYRSLAGINPDQEAPGFKHFLLLPNVAGDLSSASAKYDSARGMIVSSWKLRGAEFLWHVEIPPNTTATIGVPSGDAKAMKESGNPAAQSAGLKFVSSDGDRTYFRAESGTFEFQSPYVTH